MFGGDDGGLGFWLAMYRHEDDMEKVREIRAAASERTLSDYYLRLYNDLVRRFSALCDAVRKKVGELEQRVHAQEQELRAKDARIAELETKLNDVIEYATMLQTRETVERESSPPRATE
jgi:Mg2+ and Co2+ transporter CorA